MQENFEILLVDDDAAVRKALVEQLSELRYGILEAQSAAKALELFKAKQPQVVIADVSVPGMSSVEFTRTICRENPDALVAIVTEQSSEDWMVANALKAGARDFLEKPVDRDAIRKVLSRFRAIISNRTNKVFNPELLHNFELSFEVATASQCIAPAVESTIRALRGIVDTRELNRMEMAINEAVRNAFEHGNLGISYEEKTAYCESGTFEDVIAERSKKAQEEGKTIRVQVKVDSNNYSCTVEDDGNGFDWRSLPDPTEDPEHITSLHGRGVHLLRTVFDSVHYNEKGNCVTVTKKFR